MKKLLILLLFLSSSLYTSYEKVKKIDGIKVPKGIIANYDELENKYVITTKNFYKFEGFNGINNSIALHYTYQNNGDFNTCVELSLNTVSRDMRPLFKIDVFIDVNKIDIFIKNKNINTKKYTVDWSKKSINENEFQKYNAKAIREFSKSDDQELFNFFLNNVKKDSEIIMRFKNTKNNTMLNIEVKKREIKSIVAMFQFYQSLKSQGAKQ